MAIVLKMEVAYNERYHKYYLFMKVNNRFTVKQGLCYV